MHEKQRKRKERGRKQLLVTAILRYGITAVILFALSTVFWFLVHQIGVIFLAISCVFGAVTIGYIALEAAMYRSFCKLSKSEAAPYAVVTEYGHLQLCAGKEEDVRSYVNFCARAYARMYRPVDEKPSHDEIKASKAEQKQLAAEERQKSKALTLCRQYDNFTPADLPCLQGKRIFVSERMARAAAAESDWNAARENNSIEIVHSPALGK